MTAAILNAAADENMKIDGNFLVRSVNHTLVHLSIKNSQRCEVYLKMTKGEFHRALGSKHYFYPYKPATDEDIEKGTDVQFDQNIAYRFVEILFCRFVDL